MIPIVPGITREAGGEPATGWATALQLASEGFFVLVDGRDKR